MKNISIKIMAIFACLLILCSFFIVPAYAASYGDDIEDNIIDIPTGTSPDNDLFVVPSINQTPNSMIFLMDYMRYLYSYNMTNGQKPFLIVCTFTSVEVYCVPVETEDSGVISVVQSGNNHIINLYGTNTSGGVYQRYILHEFGNFLINNQVSSTSLTVSRNYSYIYINDDNTYSYYAVSNDENNAVYLGLTDMYLRMKSFIDASYGSSTSMVITEQLDIGSIISAVMTAPMSIFNGATGQPGDVSEPLELFGINIRSTLIAFIVIAIVIFIIKFLRGD